MEVYLEDTMAKIFIHMNASSANSSRSESVLLFSHNMLNNPHETETILNVDGTASEVHIPRSTRFTDLV